MEGLDQAADQIVAELETLIGRVKDLKNADPETTGPVVKSAIDCWQDEADLSPAYRWLYKPNFVFDGLMPLEMAAMGRGSEVIERIQAAKNSIYL